MIKRDDLIDIFERMLSEHWAYKLGAAREGCVDCSGAFVFAYEQLGGPAIVHGSNSILRQSMGRLFPMSAAQPGYAAVKIRLWSDAEAGNRWHGQTPGDCYHIGLVGRDGKILNAQGTKNGFVESDPGTWDGCAPLLDVNYGEEMEDENVLYQAKVVTKEDPLRVRRSPISGDVIGNIPRGALVSVLADSGDGWPRVRYGEWVGYASGEFLRRVDQQEATPDADDGQTTTTTLVRDDGTTILLFGSWRVAND